MKKLSQLISRSTTCNQISQNGHVINFWEVKEQTAQQEKHFRMCTLMPTIASRTRLSSGKTHLSKPSSLVGTLFNSYDLYARATHRKLRAAMSLIAAAKKCCKGIYKRKKYYPKVQQTWANFKLFSTFTWKESIIVYFTGWH